VPATATRPTIVSVELHLTEAKRNSVRFDMPALAEGEPASSQAMRTAYIGNDAWHAIGDPDRIAITIAAAS
jgi:hypothetical protein